MTLLVTSQLCRRPAVAAAVLCALLAGCTSGSTTRAAVRAGASVPEDGSTICGVTSSRAVEMSTATLPDPAKAFHVVASGLVVSDLQVVDGTVSVLLSSGEIKRFAESGAFKGSITGPAPQVPSLAVDDDGNSYVLSSPTQLVQHKPDGSQGWSVALSKPATAVYRDLSSGSLRIAVAQDGGGVAFHTDGTGAGGTTVSGTLVDSTKGLTVSTDGKYVRTWKGDTTTSGDEVIFGDDKVANDPILTGGPWHFYQQGGAVAVGDHTYVADATRGIEQFDRDGFLTGQVADATVGLLTERSPLRVSNGRVWFVSGGRSTQDQKLTWISTDDLTALASAPSAPSYVLAPGIGLTTGVTGQLFAAGTTPTVTLTVDLVWASRVDELRLAYTVRTWWQVRDGLAGTHQTVDLRDVTSRAAGVPLQLPSPQAGTYEIDARLVDKSGVARGATCFHYSVAAAGTRLDLGTLPDQPDFGGPPPARGVALADELGTEGSRVQVRWADLLPAGADSTAPIDFSHLDPAVDAALAEAAMRKTQFWLLVADGQDIDKALVTHGHWQQRVQELAQHYAGKVHDWEPWNEPNNTFGTAADYATKVLKPFAAAVHGVDPTNKVLGGSVLNLDAAYWKGIADAGGLASMDVAAIHPYTGHNRSWEEHGVLGQLAAVKAITGTLPMWNTEVAWWSDGPANFFSQADKAVRAHLLMRAQGIDVWNYFLPEGGYGDYGLSYSTIQTSTTGIDYLKPAALALSTEGRLVGGRPVTGMKDVPIPHAFAVGFGGDADTVTAAWTDDLATTAVLSASRSTSVTITDEMGNADRTDLGPGGLRLKLDSSPLYVTAPKGVDITLAPAEAFGQDLARTASVAVSSGTGAPYAIDGVSDARGNGDLSGLPVWASAPGDKDPTLTLTLPAGATVDRVQVVTSSLGSIVPGISGYDVQVPVATTTAPTGASSTASPPAVQWKTVGSVTGDLLHRTTQVSFPAQRVTAIRIAVRTVATTGFAGGARPWFWGEGPSDPAVVYEVGVFAPGASSGKVPVLMGPMSLVPSVPR